jgi:predicted MPP superfamily phosphohydrolase
MKILQLSDLHLDFYLKEDASNKRKLQQFANNQLRLDKTADIDLITIAGDLGHYNHQSLVFMEFLRDEYNVPVLYTYGNHDLYLVSSTQRNKYSRNSMNRLAEMIEMTNAVDGIHYLDGECVTIDGVTIGGVANWYDNSYLNPEGANLDGLWYMSMNDSRLIYKDGATVSSVLDFREYLQCDAKIKAVLDQKPQYVFSHVAPLINSKLIDPRYAESTTTAFYLSNSYHLLEQCESLQHWQYGHTHCRLSVELGSVKFHNASIGYPGEQAIDSPRIVELFP